MLRLRTSRKTKNHRRKQSGLQFKNIPNDELRNLSLSMGSVYKFSNFASMRGSCANQIFNPGSSHAAAWQGFYRGKGERSCTRASNLWSWLIKFPYDLSNSLKWISSPVILRNFRKKSVKFYDFSNINFSGTSKNGVMVSLNS
jgi:hypothetical protein